MGEFACNNWDRLFERWKGRRLPDSYLVLDTETTGLTRDWDLPWEIGMLTVHRRQVVAQEHYVLNWLLRPDLVDPSWFNNSLERLEQVFFKAGKIWHGSLARIEKDGIDPIVALSKTATTLDQWRKNDGYFVGHNAAYFDAVLLEKLFAEYFQTDFVFPDERMIDTGALQKAKQSVICIDPRNQLRPRMKETLRAFALRVQQSKMPGNFWNIEECVEQYKLCDDHGLCPDALHGSLVDCQAVHLMLEIHKEINRAGK